MVAPFKLFFATDIHGSETCFRKFLNAAKFFGTQALVLGGDVTGKALVPVVRQPGGWYTAQIGGHQETVSKSELDTLRGRIRTAGLYPVVVDGDQLAALRRDPARVKEAFTAALRESLESWLALAEERLKPLGIPVWIQPGNDDEPVLEEALSRSTFVRNPEGHIEELPDGTPMLSLGYSNPTPWNSPREIADEELEVRLERMAAQLPDPGQAVFNLHVPPYNSQLDMASRLDETRKPIVRGGQIEMAPVGSVAVRNVIVRHQPLLGLHGHVHESGGMAKLGRTVCINPGSEYSDGVLRGAIVEINRTAKRIEYQLVTG